MRDSASQPGFDSVLYNSGWQKLAPEQQAGTNLVDIANELLAAVPCNGIVVLVITVRLGPYAVEVLGYL
ncbi:hypothetical protein BN1708_002607 [Verticillium longisporum]|uniref:Uncharacterized protein n=1 Tax=Verticillium longisporum TaxID=100787 RepID=A0A0G4KY69_VERLO|nr:hypothetical protein BN1708_002607 [Verticillium longisporum]